MLYLPAEFPLAPDLCYLNHAAIGPWPRRTAQVVANFAHQVMTRAGTDYPDWLQTEQRLRERLARLINAGSADDIALVQNTSTGLSIISQGLDWHDGDEVLGLRGDFCSNRMTWEVLQDRGVSYRTIDALDSVDPEGALIEAMGPHTRLLAISTVQFATGYRFDLQRVAEACRSRDVLLSVDAIQSLGAIPFDQAEIRADFITCGGHKWLLSPEGQGFFFCKPEHRDSLRLQQYGWAMRESPYAFEDETWRTAATARRFEAGTPNMSGIHGMEASLSLFEEFGMQNVSARIADNIAILVDRLKGIPGIAILTPDDPRRRAGIVTFRHANCPGDRLYAALMEQGVICSPRAGGIRLSPHFYTSENVLKRSTDIIRQTIQTIQ
jgi:selenocysteine lyase/cysteine desulfurase